LANKDFMGNITMLQEFDLDSYKNTYEEERTDYLEVASNPVLPPIRLPWPSTLNSEL